MEQLDERQSPARRGSPVWLLLPILTAVGVVWYTWPDPPVEPRREADPPQLAPAGVAGWEGQTTLGGETLRVRLGPLHGSPERQAFDSASLSRRLGLERGEPWRLMLAWDGEADSAAAPAWSALEVGLANGGTLQPIVTRGAEETAEGLPADPLRALLAPPAEPLRPGESRDLVLWGPRPGTGPVLNGLPAPITLTPVELDRELLEAALERSLPLDSAR